MYILQDIVPCSHANISITHSKSCLRCEVLWYPPDQRPGASILKIAKYTSGFGQKFSSNPIQPVFMNAKFWSWSWASHRFLGYIEDSSLAIFIRGIIWQNELQKQNRWVSPFIVSFSMWWLNVEKLKRTRNSTKLNEFIKFFINLFDSQFISTTEVWTKWLIFKV